MGNCGFGVAPTRPAHRDLILRTLENVEGMSLDALARGPRQPTGRSRRFPEYLDAIEARGTAINVGALVGHTPRAPLRDGRGGDRARGDRGRDRGDARDRRARRSRAGALGFATSKAPTHVGYAGKPGAEPRRVRRRDRGARRRASAEVGARRHAGHDRPRPLPRRVRGDRRARPGSPSSWTALLAGISARRPPRRARASTRSCRPRASRVIPQVSCRPLDVRVPVQGALPVREHVGASSPCRRPTSPGKKRIYADPAFRAAVPRARSTAAVLARPLATTW